MSVKVSRRAFLSASAVSAVMLAQPLSALSFSTVKQGQICGLFTNSALSLLLQNQLINFREIAWQDLFRKENLGEVGRLRGWIKYHSGKRVVGAVGCDLYPVLETLVREANGALLFHGRHVVLDNGDTSHSFYTVPASQGAAGHFMASIAAANIHCKVSEYCIGADDQIGRASPSLEPMDDWLKAIANILVRVANREWQAAATEQFFTTHLAGKAKAVDSLETFVFSL